MLCRLLPFVAIGNDGVSELMMGLSVTAADSDRLMLVAAERRQRRMLSSTRPRETWWG